jgi:hypothetical protein
VSHPVSHGSEARLLRGRIDDLARDVGRLRRRLDAEGYDGFLVRSIADHVETLDVITQPTAHDLYIARLAFGVDEEEAVADAVADIDARRRQLQSLLAANVPANEAQQPATHHLKAVK